MRVFDLRVFLYILYYIHTTINLHTLLLFSLSLKPATYLQFLCCYACFSLAVLLARLLQPFCALAARTILYARNPSSTGGGTQALTIFHFRVPTFASTSLYFSKSKSHPAQVIIIRTSHDPISQLLHTITAPLRYPLLSTINLPSNNTGLCTVHTTINKITYYYHVFYLKQHTRHSLHIYSIMTCILL